MGPGDLRKQVCLGPKTLHYAKLWAQNATKTSAGNIPESLSNLFLRDNFGGEKTNKHKQLRGIVPEMGGGQMVYVFPFFLGKKGNT